MNHLLRDVRDKVIDSSPIPFKPEQEPSEPLVGPAQDEFDFGSYEILRRATKLASRLIGTRAATRTKRGERLVWRIVGHMKRGETLELEKLRSRMQRNLLPPDQSVVKGAERRFSGRTGGF